MPIFRRHEDAPRERTPEERERARAERAARRAGRSGTGMPDLPDLTPDDEDAPAAEPRADAAPEPRADVAPEPRAEPAPEPPRDIPDEPWMEPKVSRAVPPAHELPEEPWPEPGTDDPPPAAPEEPRPADDFAAAAPEEPPLQPTAPFDPLAASTSEEDAVGASPGVGEPAVPEEPARPPIVPPAARRARSGRPIPPAAIPEGGERPVAPKRVSAQERRLPPTPPPPGTPAFKQRRRRRGRILAALLLLLVVGLLAGVNALFQPFKGEGGEEVTVRIPPGSSIADVGDLLADSEVVDSSLLFVIRARLAGADLKAGTYQLRRDSSYGDALDALKDDPAAPRTIKVVIPEGRSRQETAPIVKEAGLSGSYLEASDTQKGFRPRKYGAPRSTKTLEGFLFPATYELKPAAKAALLVEQQLEAFENAVGEVDMQRARRRNLTVYDVLIIASMVEREATLAKERPIIAAVIHNRLRQGMPLGIDATIRYAVRNWTRPLRESELAIDSPYNTRKRMGLPPTPIGSPGLDSIKAAANPAKVDYLFYVVKPNGDGAHNFSSTDEEFQRDVEAYNEERERRGGQSPADSG